MKKSILILVSLAFFFTSVMVKADRVDMITARKIATNFYLETSVNYGQTIKGNLNLGLSFTKFSGSEEMYYVFSSSNGYVIIAADDDVYPVLAYSFEEKYKTESNLR